MFLVEKIEGDRLLVSDMNEGLRGWVSATAIVALADAEALFGTRRSRQTPEVLSPC